jgi:hypothetical protein
MRTFKEFKEYLEEKGRCWTGYKPVPGKKPYSKGSCEVKEEVEQIDELQTNTMISAYAKRTAQGQTDKADKIRARIKQTASKQRVHDADNAALAAKRGDLGHSKSHEGAYAHDKAQKAAAAVKKANKKPGFLSKMFNREEVELEESLMGHIEVKPAKKSRDSETVAKHDVHYKGSKIGHIEVYKHRSGMKYGDTHLATGDSTAGHRSMDDAIESLRQTHADHLKNQKQSAKDVTQSLIKLSKMKEEIELDEAKQYPYKFRATYHDPDTNEVTHYMDFTHRNLDAAKKHAQGSRLERKDGKQDKLHSVVQIEEEVEQIDELNYDTVQSLYRKRRDDFHGAQDGKNKKGKVVSAKNVSTSISRLMGNKPTQNQPVKEEEYDVEELFDILEEVVNGIAEESNIDPEILWENLEDVSDEELYETAAWRRKEGKNPTGGLNAKGIASYRRENPGSTLKKAVTGKVKAGSKAAKRRKSFCARMGGMPGAMKKPNGEPTRKALALRKWKCR